MKSYTTRVKIRLGGYIQIGLVARNLRAKTVASPVDKGLYGNKVADESPIVCVGSPTIADDRNRIGKVEMVSTLPIRLRLAYDGRRQSGIVGKSLRWPPTASVNGNNETQSSGRIVCECRQWSEDVTT